MKHVFSAIRSFDYELLLDVESKHPWSALIIILQWLAATVTIMLSYTVDIPQVMGMTFISTIIIAYFGFKTEQSPL